MVVYKRHIQTELSPQRVRTRVQEVAVTVISSTFKNKPFESKKSQPLAG